MTLKKSSKSQHVGLENELQYAYLLKERLDELDLLLSNCTDLIEGKTLTKEFNSVLDAYQTIIKDSEGWNPMKTKYDTW